MMALGVQPDLISYSSVIVGCAVARDLNAAVSIFEELMDSELPLDKQVFHNMLHVCSVTAGSAEALRVLRTMDEPDADAVAFAASACVGCSESPADVKRLTQILAEANDCDVLPTIRIFNAAVATYANAKDTQRAFATFKSMRQAGVQPDVSTFNSLLSCCTNQQMLDLVARMETQEIAPNVQTYRMRIKQCRWTGDTAQAKLLLNQMRENGIEPTPGVFEAFAMTAAAAGDEEQLRQAREEMQRIGGPAETEAMAVAELRSFATTQQLDKALQKVADMNRAGLVLSNRSFMSLMNLCSSEQVMKGPVHHQSKCDLLMANLGYIAPSNDYYSQITETEAAAARMMEYIEIAEQLQAKGRVASQEFYVSLLHICAEAKDVKQALTTVDWMNRNGVTVDCELIDELEFMFERHAMLHESSESDALQVERDCKLLKSNLSFLIAE